MKRVASGIVPVIALDRRDSQPLHRQIYDAYRTAILDGLLRPGQRIPSTRILASEIGVSRFPVLNAYSQLLAEGYLESRVGAGTVVSVSLPEQQLPEPVRPRHAASDPETRPIARRHSHLHPLGPMPWLHPWGAFRVGQVALDQFPQKTWSALIARRARCMDAHSAHYGNQMGSDALRKAIANYLKIARSVRCEAEQVLIVNGSQQALDIAARVLLDAGSRVWVEEPGYRLTREVFALNGCVPVPVPVDAEGMDVAAGVRKCRKARAALVTPSHQFPLGVTMSASRRLQLLDWAQKSGAWIIEDDYDSEYRYQNLPIASLQGLDVNDRVIYVGTFSKVLYPALRLGYMVIPPGLVERFLAVRRLMDLGAPTFHQEVLADFIDEGHFGRHIRRMRVLYGTIRRALVDCLQKEVGDLVEIIGDEAGMHSSVALKNGGSDREIATRAARSNLSLWPLSPLYLGEPRQGFILGFAGTPLKEIPAAVHKLRALLR